jgi:predicted aspartyl protease
MDARHLVSITLVLLVAQPARTADHQLSAAFTSTLLVLLPVQIDGHGPYYFVVDTGATTTMLDDSLAIELGIRANAAVEIVTSAGTIRVPSGTLEEIRVGAARMSRFRVSWMRLDALRRDDPRIMGVLGQDFLSGHTLVIDYRHRGVQLSSDACPSEDGDFEIAWAMHRPTIAARVQGPGVARAGRFVLDSAANALLLFAVLPTHGQAVAVSTHQATVSAVVLPRVSIELGGVRRTAPATVVSPAVSREEIGLVPTSWFSRVCIDGPRSRASLRF